MAGTQSRLTSLEVRKQLLIVESEVNRTQLDHTWLHLRSEAGELAHQARSACSTITSLASIGAAGFKAFRALRTERRTGKNSWLANLMEGVRLGTALWTTIQSPSR
jgi:hypothetical protein